MVFRGTETWADIKFNLKQAPVTSKSWNSCGFPGGNHKLIWRGRPSIENAREGGGMRGKDYCIKRE